MARANVANSGISLDAQRADCRLLAQSLAVTTGAAQGKIDTILAKGGGLPAPKGFRVRTLPSEMLRQRPDVVAAELDFAATLA